MLPTTTSVFEQCLVDWGNRTRMRVKMTLRIGQMENGEVDVEVGGRETRTDCAACGMGRGWSGEQLWKTCTWPYGCDTSSIHTGNPITHTRLHTWC